MSDTSTKGPLAMTTDRVTALLDAYDAETTSLPLGHEMPTRGASTYNWRRSKDFPRLPPYPGERRWPVM